MPLQPQLRQKIASLADHLVVVDPHVAAAREDVDVRLRLPRRARLAAVGIAEREMDARHLLVLEEDADHLRQRHVGPEGQLADDAAELVGAAVLAELALQLAALAVDADETAARDL